MLQTKGDHMADGYMLETNLADIAFKPGQNIETCLLMSLVHKPRSPGRRGH